jgi:hypothetical protein
MAGPILRAGDRLLRPAQDCSKSYGGSLVFFEIERLSETEYRERRIRETRPDPLSAFPEALHTWSPAADGRVAIDGMRTLRRFS